MPCAGRVAEKCIMCLKCRAAPNYDLEEKPKALEVQDRVVRGCQLWVYILPRSCSMCTSSTHAYQFNTKRMSSSVPCAFPASKKYSNHPLCRSRRSKTISTAILPKHFRDLGRIPSLNSPQRPGHDARPSEYIFLVIQQYLPFSKPLSIQ
jgi:hypothetical protein